MPRSVDADDADVEVKSEERLNIFANLPELFNVLVQAYTNSLNCLIELYDSYVIVYRSLILSEL